MVTLTDQDALIRWRPRVSWRSTIAGLAWVVGNAVAARVRLRAGRRLGSPALVADGQHAQSDAIVSVGSWPGRSRLRSGAPIADPIIGLLDR
ncbi:MAG: hypothetical protein QOK40_546 [Miltoncostaeaceae bacterium]|nr:hypothetical protein [Miltoncostaeaceae bacterium]